MALVLTEIIGYSVILSVRFEEALFLRVKFDDASVQQEIFNDSIILLSTV